MQINKVFGLQLIGAIIQGVGGKYSFKYWAVQAK